MPEREDVDETLIVEMLELSALERLRLHARARAALVAVRDGFAASAERELMIRWRTIDEQTRRF